MFTIVKNSPARRFTWRHVLLVSSAVRACSCTNRHSYRLRSLFCHTGLVGKGSDGEPGQGACWDWLHGSQGASGLTVGSNTQPRWTDRWPEQTAGVRWKCGTAEWHSAYMWPVGLLRKGCVISHYLCFKSKTPAAVIHSSVWWLCMFVHEPGHRLLSCGKKRLA